MTLQSPTPELMRRQNRAVILAVIQEQGPISRVELASLLGLNPATITRITRDLIADGLVKEEGEGETRGAGRKRILLRFNHSARLVIGIQVNSRQVTGVIANLANEFLSRRTVLLAPGVTLPLLVSLIDELLDENPGYRRCLTAVCVTIHNPEPIAPLVDGLKQQFHAHMLLTDVVTTACVGEAEAGGMTDQRAFVAIYLGQQSYSCIYLNGQSRVGQLGLTRDGRPLAERICDSGLVETFAAMRAEGTPSALTKAESLRPRLIFEAARRDDLAARQAVEQMVDDLAYAILWLANALDISHMVMIGPWLRAADLLIPLLQTRLHGQPTLSVTTAKLGDEASLIGAVRLANRMADATF